MLNQRNKTSSSGVGGGPVTPGTRGNGQYSANATTPGTGSKGQSSARKAQAPSANTTDSSISSGSYGKDAVGSAVSLPLQVRTIGEVLEER